VGGSRSETAFVLAIPALTIIGRYAVLDSSRMRRVYALLGLVRR
jgi:hypothetical protein